jgi:hypothetical protein
VRRQGCVVYLVWELEKADGDRAEM